MAEEEKKSFSWFTLLNWLGGGLIFLGIYVAWRLYDNFVVYAHKGAHFSEDGKLQDLGTALSGTVGLLFLLASVLFFTFTLYQTRKEMQETRGIMDDQRVIMQKQAVLLQDQQNQATFYNLLSHHAALIETLYFTDNSEGHNGLKSLFHQVQQNLFHYHFDLTSRFFPSFSRTYYHPTYEFGQNQSQLDRYMSSLVTIINFINGAFADTKLYFDILYNYLSIHERYLIGMYAQVYTNKNSECIRNCGYDFLEYQKSVTHADAVLNSIPYPMMALQPINSRFMVPIESVMNSTANIFDFVLGATEFSGSGNFYVLAIEVKLTVDNQVHPFTFDYRKVKDQKHEVVHTLNLSEKILQFLHPYIPQDQQTYPMSLLFVIEYEREVYQVEKKLELNFGSYSVAGAQPTFGLNLRMVN